MSEHNYKRAQLLWTRRPFDASRCHAQVGEAQCPAMHTMEHSQRGQVKDTCIVRLCADHARKCGL